MFFVLCFILFNDNAPLLYCFAFLFLKYSFYSTLKRAILKFDIYRTSFINCMPKVLLVISDILMSQLVFYLFNIGMTQLIYHLFNKNGGGVKTHITFLMELFVAIVHAFLTVAVVAKNYLIAGAGFMNLFSEKYIVKI